VVVSVALGVSAVRSVRRIQGYFVGHPAQIEQEVQLVGRAHAVDVVALAG
jgi:hypothetical protein